MDDTHRKTGAYGAPFVTPTPKDIKTETDVRNFWAKLDRRTLRMIEGQERVQGEVIEIKAEVAAASARIGDQSERVALVETALREGHNCTKDGELSEIRSTTKEALSQLQTLATQTVAASSQAKAVRDDIDRLESDQRERAKEGRAANRTAITTAVGSLLTIILAGSAALWYIAQLDERDEQQHHQQVENAAALKSQVERLENKVENLPSKEALEQALEGAVQRAGAGNSGPEGDQWFFALDTRAQRQFCLRQPNKSFERLPPPVRTACKVLAQR